MHGVDLPLMCAAIGEIEDHLRFLPASPSVRGWRLKLKKYQRAVVWWVATRPGDGEQQVKAIVDCVMGLHSEVFAAAAAEQRGGLSTGDGSPQSQSA